MASELELIEVFLRAFPPARARVGPGDDAAVLGPERHPLCVTTDAVVEDVHFRLGTFSFADIGHKALAVNLSDLAAMGATPAWFVCAIQGPAETLTRTAVSALGRGMAALARRHRISLVGGNFSRAAALSLTLTVTGTLPGGRALLRRGARAGDQLYVSGTLGEARRGLWELEQGVRMGPAVRRQRRPAPRLALGRLARSFAHAGLDVSDGLLRDLGHLCEASGVGAEVELARLPRSAGMRRHPEQAELLTAGGEDYELLLAVPPRRCQAFERACRVAKERVTQIGTCVRTRGVVLLDPRGQPVLGGARSGFDHFRV